MLLLAHDFRFAIKSNKAHPMRELPNALLALQQKRKRAASVAEGASSSQAGRQAHAESGSLLPKRPKPGSAKANSPQSV